MRIRLQPATPEHACDARAARSTRRLQRLRSPLAMPLVPLAPVVAALQATSLLLTDRSRFLAFIPVAHEISVLQT